MKTRLIGPLLMIALGATLLVGFGGGSTVDAGTTTPCTTTVSPAGLVDPCTTTTTVDPCGPQVGVVNPCITTTSEAEVTTTVVETSDPPVVDGTTTEPSAALPDGASSVPPAASAAPAPATASGELVRTGSDNGPLTAAGITLVVLGAGLALYEYRNASRRQA